MTDRPDPASLPDMDALRAAIDADLRRVAQQRTQVVEHGLERDRIRRQVVGYEGLTDAAFEKLFQRDRRVLRAVGVPLETLEPAGFDEDEAGVRHRVVRDALLLRDLDLTVDERRALVRARRLWGDSPLRADVVRAVGLLFQPATDLTGDDELAGYHTLMPRADPRLEALTQAVADEAVLRFPYRDARGRATRRTVRAWFLTLVRGRWYLTGWDLDRGAERSFRLTRMEGEPRRLERATDAPGRPEDHDHAGLVARLAGQADAERLCDEGLIEPIDPAALAKGADGSAAADDYLPSALNECGTAIMVWSTAIAYDKDAFPNGAPQTVADFFDTAKFPGKRGLPKAPKRTLYLALIADGVAPDQIYETLSTPEGVDRAFKKLDTIKKDVVWWEAGAQAPQLLADKEVSMTLAYNGRIFNAAVGEGKPFKIIWDGQIYEMEGWVVPKGAPNKQNAMDYIAFSTEAPQLAKAAEQISYGPPRKSAAALVGNIEGTDVPMGPNLPTYAENMKAALASNLDFWVDHDAELQERFNAWLAAS